MAVRRPTNQEASAKFNERMLKQLGRLYVLWLVGIIVGAVKVRPEQIDIGGVRYQISNPEVLQGVIFFACILYYIAIFANAIAHSIEYSSANLHVKRRMIYAALRKKPTFRSRTKAELMSVRSMARIMLGFGAVFFLTYLLLPLIHITFFQQTAVFTGVDAIFGTKSVEGGKVVLTSLPPAILTFLVLCIFTMMFYEWISKRSGANYQNIVWANAASALLYTTLDSWLRGVETWSQAVGRVTAIQVVVLAIISLYLFPLKILNWYLDLKLWWYRRLVRKNEEKKKPPEESKPKSPKSRSKNLLSRMNRM